ncbi:hypothetical protein O181_124167, partial [Austropuccinia psidii MF-1]|nr:hypothetical protein [Austropuccinia psidii MF-1]
GKLSSNGNDILICNSHNVPVLQATLCSSMLKWNMTPYLIKTTQEIDMLEQQDLLTDHIFQDCNDSGTILGDLTILTTTLTAPVHHTDNVPIQPSSNLTDLLHSTLGHIGSKRLKHFIQQKFGKNTRKSLDRVF